MRDPQQNVEHFIPPVTLKGTRGEKLRSLDLLIAHLQQLRVSLAEDYSPTAEKAASDLPSERLARVTWRDVRVAAVLLYRNFVQRAHSS